LSRSRSWRRRWFSRRTGELGALVGGDAVVALVTVDLVLAAPVAQRLGRHAEARRELSGRAGLTQQLDRLTTELLGIRRTRSGARRTPSFRDRTAKALRCP
jgi:uncharacterized protein (DUF2342 family)